MVESMVCCGCNTEFVPDTEYIFPNYYVYWHKCPTGILTQNTVIKKKKPYWKRRDVSKEENFNRVLGSFHNPLLWKNHDENNYDEEGAF